jgi:hypothetical protein
MLFGIKLQSSEYNKRNLLFFMPKLLGLSSNLTFGKFAAGPRQPATGCWRLAIG